MDSVIWKVSYKPNVLWFHGSVAPSLGLAGGALEAACSGGCSCRPPPGSPPSFIFPENMWSPGRGGRTPTLPTAPAQAVPMSRGTAAALPSTGAQHGGTAWSRGCQHGAPAALRLSHPPTATSVTHPLLAPSTDPICGCFHNNLPALSGPFCGCLDLLWPGRDGSGQAECCWAQLAQSAGSAHSLQPRAHKAQFPPTCEWILPHQGVMGLGIEGPQG